MNIKVASEQVSHGESPSLLLEKRAGCLPGPALEQEGHLLPNTRPTQGLPPLGGETGSKQVNAMNSKSIQMVMCAVKETGRKGRHGQSHSG